MVGGFGGEDVVGVGGFGVFSFFLLRNLGVLCFRDFECSFLVKCFFGI